MESPKANVLEIIRESRNMQRLRSSENWEKALTENRTPFENLVESTAQT